MRGLRQDAFTGHQEAQVPCTTALCADIRVYVNGVHESQTTDSRDETRRGGGRIHVDVLQCV